MLPERSFSPVEPLWNGCEERCGSGVYGRRRPEPMKPSIVPVVMAGVLGIYGLIIAVNISTGINPKTKSYYPFGYITSSSGLACGLAGLSAGMAIGIVGDAGVRCFDGNLIKNTEGYVLRRPITRGQQRMKACRMQICKPARKKINEDFNGKGYS
ncbi:V-type proton ATPase 16 kDa proteolipid subunit [Datura stramonium]|uniref:V-type proton ATPase proteolipid subunit n=1 Tax=Datura stramonium TaxID=4076 RepID=A0ABS8RSZ6_DATST|nr:V-type proton ATPase 16 kDa proteolipid subunit [Datura stramonium]